MSDYNFDSFLKLLDSSGCAIYVGETSGFELKYSTSSSDIILRHFSDLGNNGNLIRYSVIVIEIISLGLSVKGITSTGVNIQSVVTSNGSRSQITF